MPPPMNPEKRRTEDKAMIWQLGQCHPDAPDGLRYNANMVFESRDGGDAVAMVYGLPQNTDLESIKSRGRYEECLQLALLIAAAPELLEALENCVVKISALTGDCDATLGPARAALAKARGAA